MVTRPSAGSVPAKPAKVVPAPAPAKIALRSVPWSRVEIDGKSIGTTPIVGRELPPGRHRVRLIPGQGAFEPRTTTIEARPGVTVRVLADFRTGKVDVR